MNTFEYDGGKSESNNEKHGIDFEEAQLLTIPLAKPLHGKKHP